MSSPSVSVKDSEKTQAKKGAGALKAEGHQIKDAHTNESTLDHRQRLSAKSHNKFKKKLVVKKKIDEIYVAPALSPYLLLIISLLYMVAADGLIREDEISLLQSVTGADKSIINTALKYTQKIKLSEFLIIAPPLLKPKDRICILLNILDLMLIDGNTAEEELDYFFHLQELFGFTDEQMRPYLSILKIKTNRKILGDFDPKHLNSTEFSPHLIFGIALIYMLSADGIVNDNEVEQLQSNIASFPGLFEAASKYSKTNSVEQFLWDVRSRLNQQQSLFVLINTYDLLLSDGIAEENEKVLFDRFLASLDFDRKRFQNYADLIELKNRRPTTEICKGTQTHIAAKVVSLPSAVVKKTSVDDHHLREIDNKETLIAASSPSSPKAAEQTINNGAKAKEIDKFVLPGEQNNTKPVPGLTTKASNIQKAKSGAASENIQVVAATEKLQSSETEVDNASDRIKEELISESNKSFNQAKNLAEKLTTQVDTDQYIQSAAIATNSQQIDSDQDRENIQSLGEQSQFAQPATIDLKTKSADLSNSQLLDETSKLSNLQKLEEPSTSITPHSLGQHTTNENIQPRTENNALDPNINSFATSPRPTKADASKVNHDEIKSNQKLTENSANNTLNLQNLNSDSIKNSHATIELNQSDINSSSVVDDPLVSKVIIDIESNSTLCDSPFKENVPSPLQERFAGIYSEIVDVHEKLDLLDGSPSKLDVAVDNRNKSTSINPLVEPTKSSQVPTNPDESLLPSTIETQVYENTSNDSLDLIHNSSTDNTQDLISDVNLDSIIDVPASARIERAQALTQEIKSTISKEEIKKSSEKNKKPILPTKPFASDSDVPLQTAVSSNISQLVNPPINSNNQALEKNLSSSNFAPLDTEDISQRDFAFDSNDPSKFNPITVNTNSAQQFEFRVRDVENKNLTVFTLTEQIDLNKSSINSGLVITSNQLQLFDEKSTDGLTVSDVFAHQSNTLEISDHYSRSTHSSKILEPRGKLFSTQKFIPKISSSFIKASATAGIAALIGLYSFDTNIDIYAPCPGQTCEGRQTGAPLMIKPEPSAIFQNVFSALHARLDLES